MRIARIIGYGLLGLAIPLVLVAVILVLVVNHAVGAGIARTDGTFRAAGLQAPVRILRDERGVPHIRAQSLHDAFFAEGYAAASDRLFQMDITRRFVTGHLAELFSGAAMQADQRARIVDVRGIANDVYAKLAPSDRAILQAYADGVNAAATNEPTPPEYVALGTHFASWQPTDAIVVGFATVIDLSGEWNEVTFRDAVARSTGPHAADAFASITDPAYDTPTVGGKAAPVAPLPPLHGRAGAMRTALRTLPRDDVPGSNSWVLGAARTATHRALLANDPHLERTMPGIWWLVDLAAPGFHVAGATFAGIPGVILGHNDAIAWGSTNGTVASPRVFRETFTGEDATTYRAGNATLTAEQRVETFFDRLGNPQHRTYLRTRHGFVLQAKGRVRNAVQWDPDANRAFPLAAFFALDRARSIDDALRALAQYPGPTQNFTIAARDGRAAYHLAGHVPLQGDWGMRVDDGATTPPEPLRFVPFTQLPGVAPSTGARAVTANNRPYATGYPYRLSAAFSAPYRAAEITARLDAVRAPDVESSRAIQADLTSPVDRDLARIIVAALQARHVDRDGDLATVAHDLAGFDGQITPSSVAATIVQRFRAIASHDLFSALLDPQLAPTYLQIGPTTVTLMRALRERPRGWFPQDDADAFIVAEMRAAIERFGGLASFAQPYGTAYPVVAKHPFAALGFHGWDGPQIPGQGGSYAPAVQGFELGQSFRAIWDIGNWDAGGIDIPLGESGEPGSPHYRDLAARFAAHALTPLPYSDTAVARAARNTETLTP